MARKESCCLCLWSRRIKGRRLDVYTLYIEAFGSCFSRLLWMFRGWIGFREHCRNVDTIAFAPLRTKWGDPPSAQVQKTSLDRVAIVCSNFPAKTSLMSISVKSSPSPKIRNDLMLDALETVLGLSCPGVQPSRNELENNFMASNHRGKNMWPMRIAVDNPLIDDMMMMMKG